MRAIVTICEQADWGGAENTLGCWAIRVGLVRKLRGDSRQENNGNGCPVPSRSRRTGPAATSSTATANSKAREGSLASSKAAASRRPPKCDRLCSHRGEGQALKCGSSADVASAVTKPLLRLAELAGFALGQDFAGVLVERFGLRDQLDGFFELDVVLKFHFIAVVQAEI